MTIAEKYRTRRFITGARTENACSNALCREPRRQIRGTRMQLTKVVGLLEAPTDRPYVLDRDCVPAAGAPQSAASAWISPTELSTITGVSK